MRISEEEKIRRINSLTKVCNKCKQEFPKDAFKKMKGVLDGRRGSCKVCEGLTKSYPAKKGNPNSKNAIRTRKYREANPSAKVGKNLRNRLYFALKGSIKFGRTFELVGCTVEELMNHLQSNFLEGMSFDNYGRWHIDHITPCSSFDLTIEENQRKCFHYSNLQPLWEFDNLSKGNKILSATN